MSEVSSVQIIWEPLHYQKNKWHSFFEQQIYDICFEFIRDYNY